MSSLKKKQSTSPSNGKKQGTLFSFFSKKPVSATKKTPPPPSSSTFSSNEKISSSLPKSKSNTKPPSEAKSKSTSTSTTVQNPPSLKPSKVSKPTKSSASSASSSHKEILLSQLKVGSAISVYWPDDGEYYNAKISSRTKRGNNDDNADDHVYTLIYDDGEVEHNINLRNEDFKLVGDSEGGGSSVISQEQEEEDDEGPVMASGRNRYNYQKNKQESSKKRKIIEESDEEAEFDDEDEDEDDISDASEFIADSEEEGEEEDDDVSMTMTEDEGDADEEADDDDDKHQKKRLRLTQVEDKDTKTVKHTAKRSNDRGRSSFITPPPKKKKSLFSLSSKSSKSNSFALFASGSEKSNTQNDDTKQAKNNVREITPLSDLNIKSPPVSSSRSSSRPPMAAKIPLPLPGIVNQAGTHNHNHYTFLQPHKRSDAKNRPPSHSDYDHRSLKVDYDEIARVNGKIITPAQEQWWEIKARYADTILLFKTGKFYEIFHMDADIAVQVLGFNYMKGVDAHAGFPEIGYGSFCEKLVKAGHKVARVEQTETPDMLNERKKKTKVGKKPKVVNREVCSIVTAGTRTFCYMDDVSSLKQGPGVSNTGVGPLLSIKEVIVPSLQTDSDKVEPVCEYGITIVDAATGEVTLGQFADDVLRSRMNTLLTKYCPSEILVENGSSGASDTLLSLIKSAKNSFLPRCQVEKVNSTEIFPKSTAVDSSVRAKMERPTTNIKPWDNEQTLQELHRRGYFPKASRKKVDINSSPENGISRWPEILKACIQGGAELAISSLGAALFYLQRNLIDHEILSMGIVKGYIPPEPARSISVDTDALKLKQIVSAVERQEDGVELPSLTAKVPEDIETQSVSTPMQFPSVEHDISNESAIDHLSLDGTTIANLEILANSHSNTVAGSLWSKINFTKNPCGSRLLRAWLLRPLFRKTDIERRADAVEELTSGGAAAAMAEARAVLSKCGDIERLLSRVHSMGYVGNSEESSHHPNERAVLYENVTHTKRKVGDFSKLVDGLKALSRIPEIFGGVDIASPLLGRIVRTQDKGGLFPSNLDEELDWFTNNFDCKKAAEGNYEPSRGVDEHYDDACDEIERIETQLEDYKKEMCEHLLRPKHIAKTQWKYVNTKVDSKDKFLIELPTSVEVPGDFIVKGKR